MSVVRDIAAKAASLLSRSAATDLSHGRQAVVGCRLEPSPVGAKDSQEIFRPYWAHRHIGPTVHGLAPVGANLSWFSGPEGRKTVATPARGCCRNADSQSPP